MGQSKDRKDERSRTGWTVATPPGMSQVSEQAPASTAKQSFGQSERLFIAASVTIQIALALFFAMRKWSFPTAMQIGWVVYALAIPAVAVSIVLLKERKPWYLWIAGFLFALWSVFGTVVDIVHPVSWRSPILWSIFIPYVLLYTVSQMFYWWPLLRLHRPSWFIWGALYGVSTFLNLTSH